MIPFPSNMFPLKTGPVKAGFCIERLHSGPQNRYHQTMSPYKTPLEIYALLPRTNCGDCGIATCLGFAAAVLKGEKLPADCPHLDRETRERLEGNIEQAVNMERIREQQLAELRKELAGADLFSRAALLGGRIAGGRLVITCLGKEFSIDPAGMVASQCHTHPWFTLPLLDYVLHSEGVAPSGRWVPFRELPQGRTWAPLYERRCEQPLAMLADGYSDLFDDLVRLFSGTATPPAYSADIAVTLHPFPKVPLLICYWRPEDGMDSKLHLFFDDQAERNLPVESLFTMTTGIARMLEKILHTHTGGVSPLD